MRRFISTLLVLFLTLPFFAFTAQAEGLLPTLERQISDGAWNTPYSGSLSMLKDDDGKEYLAFKRNTTMSWSSLTLDLFPYLKEIVKNGECHFRVVVEARFIVNDSAPLTVSMVLRSAQPITGYNANAGNQYFFGLGRTENPVPSGTWLTLSTGLGVTPDDVVNGAVWNLCFDNFKENCTEVHVRSVTVEMDDNKYAEPPARLTVEGGGNGGGSGEAEAEAVDVFSGNEKGNLLADKAAVFEELPDAASSGWFGLFSCDLSLDSGFKGQALKAENFAHTWSTPAVNIRPCISEPGTYSVAALVKCDTSEGTHPFSLTFRGTVANSFMPQKGGNVIETLAKVDAGSEWKVVSGSFTVNFEDLKAHDPWNLCFDGFAETVNAFWIDQVTLVKGNEEAARKAMDADEIVNRVEGRLFSPVLPAVAWVTSGVTVAVVILTITIKCCFKRRSKNGEE